MSTVARALPRVSGKGAVWESMSTRAGEGTWVELSGEDPRLVALLREPIGRALADRSSFYLVSIDTVGCVGEVLISITGTRGHVPLCFAASELDPGHVAQVVRDTVCRRGL